MKKRCTKCKQLRLLSEFTKNKNAKDGLQWTCKPCAKKYYRIHKIKILENCKKCKGTESAKLKTRNTDLKRNFGITLEQYDEMLENQNGVCAICGGINFDGRRLAVDHNHKTGKIRDLLCMNCNHFIGQAKENIIVLQSAINYLKRHET